jgi:hypothetical protein
VRAIDLIAGNWYGFVAPSGTPKDVVEKLNKSIVEALRSPTVSARLQGLGLTVIADKPEEFGALIAEDAARMQQIVSLRGRKLRTKPLLRPATANAIKTHFNRRHWSSPQEDPHE